MTAVTAVTPATAPADPIAAALHAVLAQQSRLRRAREKLQQIEADELAARRALVLLAGRGFHIVGDLVVTTGMVGSSPLVTVVKATGVIP